MISDSRVIKYTKFGSSNKMIFDLSDLKNFRLGSSKRALKIFENLNPPVYYYLFILLLKPPLSIIYNFFNSKKFSIVNAHLKNGILKKSRKKYTYMLSCTTSSNVDEKLSDNNLNETVSQNFLTSNFEPK